ncbi:hypothetical protein [Thiorhodovibrio frisius]|uniref:Uncharacterized protein n=1 Tax=Thiorhodovibrio frisius TaxID=631362 RepID=H8Z7K9_9GAMM|nr:hypothetical protein [Thiorhodovibrio frisius]EIC20939.1 hypothetical protein Thi970DRAFT_04618 [Thiorhodovibrio frisius]WPL21998.1 hypothetical protein Thiofri_02144 [Thiorhodovibrio frisius]
MPGRGNARIAADAVRGCRRGPAALPALLLIGLVLFGSGCATTPTGPGGFGGVSGLPSTLLGGASIDEARSVAMAAALSKGWDLVPADGPADGSDTEQQRLILERSISPASPQAVALGTLPGGPAPKVQVEADLVERETGTEVGLRAFMVVNPGSESEKRIEYTDDFEQDLAVSLSALQSAWLATEHRLASPAPVPEAPAAPAPDDITSPSAAAAIAASSAPVETTAQVAADVVPSEAPASDPGPVRSVAGGTSAAMAPSARIGADTQSSASNPMLVLNTGAGTWSYYAERFAEQRGCELSDNGAALLRKTASFELHEVGCRNGGNLLVKCQDGICQAMR